MTLTYSYGAAASWVRKPDLATDPVFVGFVDEVYEELAEHWRCPTETLPTVIRAIVRAAIRRGWASGVGERLESLTRTIDDASRTERFAASSGVGSAASEYGYFTPAEIAVLNNCGRSGGAPASTIGVKLSW